MNKDALLIAEAYKKVLNEGSKYRLLKPGDTLKPGDEVKSVHLDSWLRLTFKKDANGKPIKDPNWKVQPDDRKEYRRPVNEAVEQSLGNVLSSKKVLNEGETWGVENKIREALREVEGVGYGGDGLDPLEVARLVVGSQGDWGDSYEPLVQALTHVVKEYYERGIQDS